MIARIITYLIVASTTIACVQTADAAHRRRKPKAGNMSLGALRARQFNATTVIDYKTGQWHNETIFSSANLPSFGAEEDGPVKEPACVITRSDLQSIVTRVTALFPTAVGAASSIATGNPLPVILGGSATGIWLLIHRMLYNKKDVAVADRALHKDLSAIIAAIEHDRWAKQHPRLAALGTRKALHLKSE